MNIHYLLRIMHLKEIGKPLESYCQEKANFKDIKVNGIACIYKTCDRVFGDVFYDYEFVTIDYGFIERFIEILIEATTATK